MTTITPNAFGGATIRPVRRSRPSSTARSTPTRTVLDLRPAPQPVVSPVAQPTDANTAELLLASADLVGRRSTGDRSPWLATGLVLAGVLLAVLLTVAAALFTLSLFYRPGLTLGGWSWTEVLIVVGFYTMLEGYTD